MVAELDALVYGIIERCRKGDSEAEHLLARLVNARDENGEAMSDAQLRDEAVTMLLAGHETTALVLSFAVYLLSEHPDAATRLREELGTKVGARSLTLPDLSALPYLDAVVKEALRLYPPAWSIGREIIQPSRWAAITRARRSDHDQRVPYAARSTLLQGAPRFMPERWLDGSTDALPRFAYFPFGGGNRVCIGNHFATMEAQLVLGTMLQHLELTVTPGFELKLDPIVTLRSKTGIPARVHRREAQPV